MQKYTVRGKIGKEADKELSNYPEFLRNLLFYRGLASAREAEKFLNPAFEKDAHDPFLMKDMDKAVLRIEEAIEHNERILVYGDYDVDGTSAVALVYSYLKVRIK